jgi:phytoene dehydrogenase-like protein
VKTLKDVKTPSQALLAQHRLDMQQWVAISQVIGLSMRNVVFEGQRERIEESLAEARQKRDAATGQDKETYAKLVELHEAQLEALVEGPPPTEIDRRNVEVFERWKDRIEAAAE